MNLWHDVTVGDNTPEEVNAIIEVPKRSHNKYEIDKESGLIALDRANYSSSPYPIDYGFAPQTYWYDDDPLDIAVLTTFPLHPGVLATVRPVAFLEMTDDGDDDSKIIAVPVNDRRWEDVQSLQDLNRHTLRELRHFFETYKTLKTDDGTDNPVKLGEFKDKDAAQDAVTQSIRLYKDKISS